ncbi:hypothetical protein SAMN02745121_05196 [Nannocystis exedens]|uniref:Uncharacterized protein n=1 Tax=Nannocystis exedens TaxID=54 RepID=A0A1I2CQR3_9BACT|nr:hypothetical protein [Nannocystis exedens]PCC68494.1 hypothetical protein NAEX_01509 [Nannocystis exedens]SFE70512.1 hypothetical protein SAMN02745121_05196 [Nannocystis exedens]
MRYSSKILGSRRSALAGGLAIWVVSAAVGPSLADAARNGPPKPDFMSIDDSAGGHAERFDALTVEYLAPFVDDEMLRADVFVTKGEVRSAPTTTLSQEREAVATFQSVQGCLETFVLVIARTLKEKTVPGPWIRTRRLDGLVTQVDVCNDVVTMSGDFSSDDPELRIKDLRSAELEETVTFFDTQGIRQVTFEIDLTWTATGPISQDTKSCSKEMTPDGELVIECSRSRQRPAVATGTILFVGTDFDFAVGGSDEAFLMATDSVTIELP